MKTLILCFLICTFGQRLAFAQEPYLHLPPSGEEVPVTFETAATAELTSILTSPAASQWAYQQAEHRPDLEKALAAAQELVALRPDYGPAYHTLGQLYLEQGQLPAAEATFLYYLKIAPTDPQAYEDMAHYYLAAQQYGQAADAFHEAARLGSKSRTSTRRL